MYACRLPFFALSVLTCLGGTIILAVISGDCLILRGRPGPQGQPPKERFEWCILFRVQNLLLKVLIIRILHLADITSPRMGSSTRDDEVGHPSIPIFFPMYDGIFFIQQWAFESREFLRALAVGKEVSFVSTHSLPPNEDVPRDFGNAEIGGLDVASELLKNGWTKIKEFKRDPTEEDIKKKDLENEAKAAGKGLWNPHGPQVMFYFF
jgi:staphylococcal nuclease domain-containing protein 1